MAEATVLEMYHKAILPNQAPGNNSCYKKSPATKVGGVVSPTEVGGKQLCTRLCVSMVPFFTTCQFFGRDSHLNRSKKSGDVSFQDPLLARVSLEKESLEPLRKEIHSKQ